MRPRADRITSLAAMARQERDLQKAVHGAIATYLAAVARAVEPTAVRASADPNDVNLNGLDQSALWPDILAAQIVPHLHTIVSQVGLPAGIDLSQHAATAVSAWRSEWLRKRTQLLANVPQTITDTIRAAIAENAALAGPDTAAAAKIVREHLNPNHLTWKNRAVTIARTEVVGANNQGGLASWSAVHQSLAATGGQVLKTWLATGGPGSREDHNDVDGTEIGVDDTFTVGGEPMSGPGDETASADNLVNCRCTLTYRVEDGDDADGGADDPSVTAAAPITEPAPAVNGDVPSGAAVMLMLDQASAARLAVEGGEDPGQMHVTLGYLTGPLDQYVDGTLASVLDALAPLVDSLPVEADAFAVAHFNPEDDEREPCAVVLVQSDALATIHGDVEPIMTTIAEPTFPIWYPHITVAYNQGVDVIPAGATGGTVTFDRLVLGWADTVYTVTNPPPDPEALVAAQEAPVTTPAEVTTPEVEDEPAGVAEGAQWTGPLAPLDVACADGRMLAAAGGVIRQLPLPLSFQRESSHGGEEAGRTTIVGRITACTLDGGQIQASGDWLDSMTCFDALEAAGRVSAGLGMVSVDVAPIIVTYGVKQPDGTVTEVDPMLYEGDPDDLVMVATEWELMGATLVADPAFGTARIQAVPGATLGQASEAGAVAAPSMTADAASPELPVLTDTSVTFPNGTVLSVGDQVNVVDALGSSDGPTEGTITAINPTDQTVTVDVPDGDTGNTHSITVEASNLQAAAPAGDTGLTAAAAPHRYPAEWFEPVALDAAMALTITDEGRVYGHLATWGVCHTGFADQCVTAPSSGAGYAYFHLGEVDTTGGSLAVGKLTVGGGHADAKAGWRGAVEHYDNAGAAVAVVRAHEDEHGIQVTGALVPGASSQQIAALKRSPLSGDWRRIGGNLEMVGALSVNVPGFPVPRAALAASGEQLSLVAAGVVRAETGDGDPEPGGMTMPSGAHLTSVDVALLASAFDRAAQRRVERDALRAKLRREQRQILRARVAGR